MQEFPGSILTILIYVILALGVLGVISFIVWKFSSKKTPSAEPAAPPASAEFIKPSQLIESISEGLLAIDNNGTIQLINPACTKMLGWSQNDAIGLDYRSVFSFVDDQGQPIKEVDPITEAIRQNQPVNRDVLVKGHDGELIELNLSVSLAEGQQKTAVVVARDVSEFNRQQRQKEEFISTASHEMRTPVAAIEGYISLALNQKVSVIDDKARDFLNRAHEATQHLGVLFRDLLTASKSEDGRLENHPEPIDIKKFLQKLVEDSKFTTDKKGLELKFAIDGDGNISPLYYVLADPERLREVLVNIIDNAVKFTEKGSITIRLKGDTNYVTMSVADSGVGIAQEDIGHLFQKFYRIDNSETRSVGGTGLGLFICKQIIDLYNGRIWAESTYGQGSTFFIQLPRLDEQRAQSLINPDEAQKIDPGTLVTSTVAELAHQSRAVTTDENKH